MSRGEARQAQMPQPNRKILRRRRGVVGQEHKGRTALDQGENKLLRARDELVRPVNHAVHVYQVSCIHNVGPFGLNLNGRKPYAPPMLLRRRKWPPEAAKAGCLPYLVLRATMTSEVP